MYKIEKTAFGFKILFADFIKLEEMNGWLAEEKKLLIMPPK
jgi:hypothetical protein